MCQHGSESLLSHIYVVIKVAGNSKAVPEDTADE